MKIQIAKKELMDVIKINDSVKTGSTIPVLSNFKFSITSTEMQIFSTDLELDIITELPISIMIDEDFVFLVDRKTLMSTLNSIKNSFLDVTVNFDDNILEIKSGNSKFKLPIVLDQKEIDAYPNINIENTTEWLPYDKIHKAMSNSLAFVGNDEIRPAMNGINFISKKGKVIIASTDAQRLYKEIIAYDLGHTINTIIPPSKMFKTSIEEIAFYSTDNPDSPTHTLLRNDKFMCRIRNIEGRFPNFDAVIPKNFTNIISLDKTQLQVAIGEHKASFMKHITFLVRDTKMIISTENFDTGISTLSFINVDESNISDDFIFATNLNFLSLVLNAVDNNIMMKMSDPNRPIILSDGNENKTVLIMPVMINNLNYDFDELYQEILGETKEKIKIIAETVTEEPVVMPEEETGNDDNLTF